MTQSAAPESGAERHEQAAAWLDAFLIVARHFRCEFSEEAVRIDARWRGANAGLTDHQTFLNATARRLGLELSVATGVPEQRQLGDWRLPLVFQFHDGSVGAAVGLDTQGRLEVALNGDAGLVTPMSEEQLRRRVAHTLTLRPRRNSADPRVDAYVAPYRQHWLRRIVLRDLRPYRHVLVASLVANVLALAGLVFAMQVYDRVIPAESMPTLQVLFIGVAIALLFEFMLRVSRVRIIDLTGRKVDLQLSDHVFGHALRIRPDHRPRSTGTFVAQLRELERVREFMTSSTISVLADLPFFLLFAVAFWYVAGPLVWVPLAALVLLVLPGLLSQGRLARLAREAMRESSLRNAVLLEAIQGSDDIKTMQAESRIQSQWNRFNAVTANANLRLRTLTSSLQAWGQTIQLGAFAVVVFFGAPLVMAGDMTTGSLVAASILASRMLAPMGQLNQVLSRWQHARVAADGLDGIMRSPVDHPEGQRRVHRSALQGRYAITEAAFQYHAQDQAPALRIGALSISPGERIVILGRNGAGKTSLLRALAGLMPTASGEITLDGVRLDYLDPADVRRDVGLLTQSARLFHGTLRDNLLLGAPHATDSAILDALVRAGVGDLPNRVPNGLDYLIMEGGEGLSGGQRQAILLARMLLREPPVLLLDEPTSGLDEQAEAGVMRSLKEAIPAGTTLVVASHRRALLTLASRILVVDNGRIILDAPREDALRKLRGQAPAKRSRVGA